jgi:membrane protein implicated in regulation of membrane protease activity
LKALSAIIGLVVFILWLISATLIAAPPSVINTLPLPPMGGVPPAFLGVLLFLISIVLITFWAGMGPDNPEPEKTKTDQLKQ